MIHRLLSNNVSPILSISFPCLKSKLAQIDQNCKIRLLFGLNLWPSRCSSRNVHELLDVSRQFAVNPGALLALCFGAALLQVFSNFSRLLS